MKNMISIQKMDRGLVRDFLIKLRDYVNVLKQFVLLEDTGNNSLKHTKFYIKKDNSVI